MSSMQNFNLETGLSTPYAEETPQRRSKVMTVLCGAACLLVGYHGTTFLMAHTNNVPEPVGYAVAGMRPTYNARAATPAMSTNPKAPVKLGINGFGRIGRQVARIAMDHPEFQLEHDTVHGRFDGTVEVTDKG